MFGLCKNFYMKMKLDLKLTEVETSEKNDARWTINLPTELKNELLKLPSRSRNRKTVEFFKALVKENAS